ncbi:MAG TPA: heme-binding protein [Novosphingobium sp.]|nr:heme-binding protein [Novosphingobium sp.]
MTISLSAAQAILTAGLGHARAAGLKPVAVVVLDAGGHPVAMAREDGATFFRAEIARAKAYGALGMGANTAVIAERARGNPTFFGGVVTTVGGDLVFSPGGVLVMAGGVVVGAVGVSGDTGENDEAVAQAGIAAAGLAKE